MITYFKRTLKDNKLKKLKEFEVGSWINVINPTNEEINFLSEKFRLDKQNLISGLDENEIPRVEFTRKATYIFTKTIFENYELQTYLIVKGYDFLLTLSKKEPDFIKRILENRIKFVTTQKLKCIIKIFYEINKKFEFSTIDIVKKVRSKKRLTSKLKERDINVLLEYEDVLNDFVSYYHYINLLYEKIVKRIKFFESDKKIIEDLIIDSKEGFNLCKSSLKMISNIRNYHMILLSNKLNRIITLLTIFTILIASTEAISGIFGMNVKLPLQDQYLAFYYIVIVMILSWIALIFYFKKKDII